MTEGAPLLELRGVSKVFGAVQGPERRQPHGPAGQGHRAGRRQRRRQVRARSRPISGLWQPTEGEILWEGKPVHIHSPNDAEALGITTIYQDLALCDNLDIVQNMFLGHEKLRHGPARRVGHGDGGTQDPGRPPRDDGPLHPPARGIAVGRPAPVGRRRQSRDVMQAKLVIMDEPTAALGVGPDDGMVLNLIKTLSSRGVAVMVVSHNLNDVFEVADRLAMYLHLGKMVAQGPADRVRPPGRRRLHDDGPVGPGCGAE